MADKKKREKGTQRIEGPKYVPMPIEAVGPDSFIAARDQLLLDVFGSHLGALLDDACKGLTNMDRRGSIHRLIALGRADEFDLHMRGFVERAEDDAASAVEQALLAWDLRESERQAMPDGRPDWLSADGRLLPEYSSPKQPVIEPPRSGEQATLPIPIRATSLLELTLDKAERWQRPGAGGLVVVQIFDDAGVALQAGSIDYYRRQAAALAERLGRDLAEFVASTTIGELLEHLTQDAESRDLAVMPREGPEPGPQTEAEVDDADLFQATLTRACEEFADARASARSLYRPMQERLQAYLDELGNGFSFGSTARNKAFANALSDTLKGLGLALECSTCGHPAFIGVTPSGSREEGSWEFKHGSKTHGGTAVLPPLKVIIPGWSVRRLDLRHPSEWGQDEHE